MYLNMKCIIKLGRFIIQYCIYVKKYLNFENKMLPTT